MKSYTCDFFHINMLNLAFDQMDVVFEWFVTTFLNYKEHKVTKLNKRRKLTNCLFFWHEREHVHPWTYCMTCMGPVPCENTWDPSISCPIVTCLESFGPPLLSSSSSIMLFVFLLCCSIEHVQWYMSQLEFIGTIGWGLIYCWTFLLHTIHVRNPSMVQCRTKLMGFHTRVLGCSFKEDCYWQVFLIWLHIQQLGLCLWVCVGGRVGGG